MNSKITKILMMALMLQLFYSCSQEKQSDSEQINATVVRTTPLEYRQIDRKITYNANLQPFREVHLAPSAPGRIEKVYPKVGDRVRQGETVARMDNTQLHQAILQLERIEEDYRNMDTLQKTGSIPQQQFQQIYTQYKVAKSNVEFLEQNTSLPAPFTGVVTAKYFEDGEMFSGTPNTPVGKAAILSIIQSNMLKAYVNIPERFYHSISDTSSAYITVPGIPGEVFTGKVNTKSPSIDASTRTFEVELVVANINDRLAPGMFATASLSMGADSVFAVPSLALLKQQGTDERYIFLEENGIARRVVVETGERFNDLIEIISDQIKPGSNLIIAGHSSLSQGSKVEVIK
jgi:RND family efflux transporter MFP subunit